MKSTFLVLLCMVVSMATSSAGTRVLTFIYQPLTTQGADELPSIIVTRVPALMNSVSENLVHHIASPNRLVQDASSKIDDSNILSRLGVSIEIKFLRQSHYAITLDVSRMTDPQKLGVTAAQVVEAAIGCIRRTIDETHLFHRAEQQVTWEFRINGKPSDQSTWKSYERTYEAAPANK